MKRNSCREQRLRVFVTYGDTTGYTTWAKRGQTSYEDISAYNRHMYDEYRRYAIATGDRVKFLSDGLVSFKEMVRGHNCGSALSVLRSAYELQQRMAAVISSMRHPRPDGYRVRVACGMVSKMWIPPIGRRDRRWLIEYVGFSPSLGDRILKIERSIPCMTTETVRQLLKPDTEGVEFKKISPKDAMPPGIDLEDMRELLSFEFTDGRKACRNG